MSGLAKFESVFDPKSLLLGAWLVFCGWSYVQSFLGQFGFQASLSDIPVDQYLYYALRPTIGPIENFDLIGLSWLAAIGAVIYGLAFVSSKHPTYSSAAFGVFALLAFLFGNELALRSAFIDARFLARGCGTAAYVVLNRTIADDLALTAVPLIRANQDQRLMLAWRTKSVLLVVDSDPLAFRSCVRIFNDIEARRQRARDDAAERLRASNRRGCRDMEGVLQPVSFALNLDDVQAVVVQDTIAPIARRFRFLRSGDDSACVV